MSMAGHVAARITIESVAAEQAAAREMVVAALSIVGHIATRIAVE